MIAYPIELTADDNDTFLVTCPDLPEVTTFGSNLAECMAAGRMAVSEAVAARLSGFEDIPKPAIGEHTVALDLQMTLKTLLFWALKEAKMSRADLVRALDLHRPQVDRLFDPSHATRLDQYEAAFRAMGRMPHVTLKVA